MSYVPEDMDRIKDLITSRAELIVRENLGDHNILSMVNYALQGGKRLRGILLVMSGLALNGELEKLLDPAVALELGHSASLIHDDIVDSSDYRRGKIAFWRKYGLGLAVITPHLMIALALDILSKYGLRVVRKGIRSWRKAALGQLMDALIARGEETDVSYEGLVALKTGSVFEAACYIGSYLASNDVRLANSLGRYGLYLGIAYQVLDDFAGFSSGNEDSGSMVLFRKIAGERDVVKNMLRRYLNLAISALDPLNNPRPFTDLARIILSRFMEKTGLNDSLLK
ncbi:MAG: hypothetical protein DRJ41_00240 [Thermoprotei archaeon]|nr:MAG: hypothetical protein DRJ41_00240 [Thermoprotei archaeon]